MKCLRRNMTEFEYIPYSGLTSDLNEDEEHTGEFHPVYDSPIQCKGNISVPSGYTNQTFYGTDIRYTHVLVMENNKPNITETGLVRWKGELYDVRAVRQSLNGLSVALRRQTKDNNPDGDD